LSGVARDAGPNQSIGRERHRLHLTVGTHVERVRTGAHRNSPEIVRIKMT